MSKKPTQHSVSAPESGKHHLFSISSAPIDINEAYEQLCLQIEA